MPCCTCRYKSIRHLYCKLHRSVECWLVTIYWLSDRDSGTQDGAIDLCPYHSDSISISFLATFGDTEDLS